MEAAESIKLNMGDNPLRLPDWRESLSRYINGTLEELIR